LSTAIFEGAQQRILAPYTLQACFINSTIVVVFPVPGGPWITPMSFDFMHITTASRYTVFKDLDIYSGKNAVGSFSSSVLGSNKPHKMSLSQF